MNKISWCKKKKGGIRIINPNSNLAEAYVKKAEDSLKSMRINKIKDWKIATAYYTMYFSLYSILMKIGVKCEIHSCTIEFAKHFLRRYFSNEEIDFLSSSLKARIDVQYYVKREIEEEQFDEIIRRAPKFFVKCKHIKSKITEKEITEIRNKLK